MYIRIVRIWFRPIYSRVLKGHKGWHSHSLQIYNIFFIQRGHRCSLSIREQKNTNSSIETSGSHAAWQAAHLETVDWQINLVKFKIWQSTRADPGFEVWGGANGLDNLKTGGWGIVLTYFIFFIVCISQIRYISNMFLIQYSISYLYNIVIKIVFGTKFSGGARPVCPPLNPPLE